MCGPTFITDPNIYSHFPYRPPFPSLVPGRLIYPPPPHPWASGCDEYLFLFLDCVLVVFWRLTLPSFELVISPKPLLLVQWLVVDHDPDYATPLLFCCFVPRYSDPQPTPVLLENSSLLHGSPCPYPPAQSPHPTTQPLPTGMTQVGTWTLWGACEP